MDNFKLLTTEEMDKLSVLELAVYLEMLDSIIEGGNINE